MAFALLGAVAQQVRGIGVPVFNFAGASYFEAFFCTGVRLHLWHNTRVLKRNAKIDIFCLEKRGMLKKVCTPGNFYRKMRKITKTSSTAMPMRM